MIVLPAHIKAEQLKRVKHFLWMESVAYIFELGESSSKDNENYVLRKYGGKVAWFLNLKSSEMGYIDGMIADMLTHQSYGSRDSSAKALTGIRYRKYIVVCLQCKESS